jgi:hypothetical protein
MPTQVRYPTAHSGDYTNGQNAFLDDGVYATVSPANYATLAHTFYDFGFDIPSDATINSVTIEIQRRIGNGGSRGVRYINCLKNNATSGTEYSSSAYGDEVDTIISKTDNGTWSVSQLNAGGTTGFKVYLAEFRNDELIPREIYIDFVRASINFTSTPTSNFAQII